MRLAVVLLWTSAALAGCSLDIKLPEGRIACADDSDCPAHWVCSAAGPSSQTLCYRSAQLGDAGVVEGDDLDAESPAERDAEAQAKDAAPVLSVDAAAAARDATIEAPLDATSELDTGSMAPNDASRLDAGDASDASVEASADAATDASGLSDASDASDASLDAAPDASANRAPTITAVTTGTRYINTGSTTAGCIATDLDADPLSFAWSTNLGTFSDSAARSTRYMVGEVGEATLTCRVSDGRGGSATSSTRVGVYPSGWLTLLPFELSTLDMSGNARPATINGGVFVADRHGNAGWAVQLDGVANDITLPDESAFDLDTYSVVVRLNPTALTHGRTLVSKASNLFGNFTISIYADNDSVLPRRMQFSQNLVAGGPYSIVLGNYQITSGSSIQFALTLNAARELRAYVDGVLIHSQNSIPLAEHNDAPVVVGNGLLGAFAGVIDEVQMYNRALTAQEVAALAGIQ